ncbi:agmatine deiminase family protein [Kitasatospora sp. NPDC004669]|uniref:agmatine deiminase family protein n=1 Tax=Kitasatospora sp. NPDC004669 TaxID=3154555 RepID=UPI0033B45659
MTNAKHSVKAVSGAIVALALTLGLAPQAVAAESAPVADGTIRIDGPEFARPSGPVTAGRRQGRASTPIDDLDAERQKRPEIYGFTPLPTDVAVVPGEFEPVGQTLIAWTINDDTDSTTRTYFIDLIRAVSSNSRTLVVGGYAGAAQHARTTLTQAGVDTSKIEFMERNLDSWWMRDYGPIAARRTDGSKRFIHTRYYQDRLNDDALATGLANQWNIPISRPKLESEGGNFQSDGAGGCIVTNDVLNRPLNLTNQLTAADLRDMFGKLYGCRTTTILDPIKGEGTGHVDMFATFTGKRDVLVGAYDPKDDPENAKVLDGNADRLTAAGYQVHRIPMPGHGDDTYRSYTNSLAVNDAVLVPVYTDDTAHEREAMDAYRAAYPNRKIVPIDATSIIKSAGAIHCTTMTISKL